MATSVSVGENNGGVHGNSGTTQLIRVILADTQAIFRAGLRKIFALEDDIRVVGQAETLPQTQSAVTKFSADVLIFESALAPNPVETVTELLRQAPQLKIVVVTPAADEQLTLELFRRGAHGILSREVEPETLVDCLRKVAAGEPWLENQAIHWVMEAYRGHNLPQRYRLRTNPSHITLRPHPPLRHRLHLRSPHWKRTISQLQLQHLEHAPWRHQD